VVLRETWLLSFNPAHHLRRSEEGGGSEDARRAQGAAVEGSERHRKGEGVVRSRGREPPAPDKEGVRRGLSAFSETQKAILSSLDKAKDGATRNNISRLAINDADDRAGLINFFR